MSKVLVGSPELQALAPDPDEPLRFEVATYIIGLSILFMILVLVLAIFSPLILRTDPNIQHLLETLQPPSRQYLLGTDDLGRDIFMRTIAGARTAIIGPVVISVGAMLIGSVFGLIAGYKGGLFDGLIMRVVDLMYALPGLLMAIVVVGILGGGYWNAVLLLTIFYAPTDIRIIRGATLEQRGLPYVEAARTLGLPQWRIMVRHIWPNLLPLVVANTFLHFAYALVSLSTLSFLGLGVGPGQADWGRMLAESRIHLFDSPAGALVPGAMIVLTAASLNLIGDWLFEKLSLRGRAR